MQKKAMTAIRAFWVKRIDIENRNVFSTIKMRYFVKN